MIRANVILAVTKRNFRSYFSGILGYLFIIVFCVAASVMAFDTQFFAANQANLDQLSGQFPVLLLFLIPAITMTTWSDEKKLGTDELLFTLPATDVEILIGKYLAVLGVYTVALLFSLVNAGILQFIGSPDNGLIISSYLGYWLSGAALLAVGMLASSLTSSATVAFVLGVVFCCVPVFIGSVTTVIEWLIQVRGSSVQIYGFRTFVERLSLQDQLRDFSVGVMPLTSICYFLFLTLLALYLNLVVISRRRWAGQSASMGTQYTVRAVCLGITGVSLLVLSSLWPVRADLTEENLFTLSDATKRTLSEIGDQQITIQAFVSPEVPREYSDTRRRLLGLLREFDQRGGASLDVRRVDVEPFSEEAEEARALGVNPVRVQYEQDGKFEEAEVFLGAIVQSPTDNVEIPFFGKGLPIEYELTRSVRTVSQNDRLTIGVLQTDADVISAGGMMGGGGRDWAIVNELRKQYKVINVNPSQKILAEKKKSEDESSEGDDADDEPAEDFDVLLAIMPSSLTQPQMDNFLEYVESGKPTLIFDDPVPIFSQTQFGLSMAPKLPKPSPGGGMMMQQRQPPEQKAEDGELKTLCSLLDMRWNNGQVVYDRMNPHSQFGTLPPEYVFISRSGNPKEAFNKKSPITQDLHDIVCLYPGSVQHIDRKKDQKFTALLTTSGESGLLEWDNIVSQSFNMMTMSPTAQLTPNPRRFDDGFAHVVAAHVTSDDSKQPLNVIFCADVDMISDWFFMERNSGNLDISFDNVTFVLNAVDALAGEDNFIELRSRRASLRTLQYVENQTRDLRTKLNEEEKDADEQMKKRLDEARAELQEEIDKIKSNEELDPRSREQLLRTKQEQLNKKLDADERELEQDKNSRIRKAGLDMKRQVRRIENWVRFGAYVVPAILPICFGLLFLGLRNLSEQQSITSERRRR
ncbi:MAG: Gldg family protein [Planctomycetaceae bacterium]